MSSGIPSALGDLLADDVLAVEAPPAASPHAEIGVGHDPIVVFDDMSDVLSHASEPTQQTQPKGIDPRTGEPFKPVEIPVPERGVFDRLLKRAENTPPRGDS